MGLTALDAGAAPDQTDSRQLVEFPDPMRLHTIASMRDHLLALQEIDEALPLLELAIAQIETDGKPREHPKPAPRTSLAEATLEDVARGILADIREHVAGAEQYDDMTFLFLRVE